MGDNMRNSKNVIIVVICIAVLFMGVGYAVLSSKLTISGSGTIASTWDVKITGVTCSGTGDAYNVSNPTYSSTSATLNVGLKKPTDVMTCTITIKNNGSLNAKLSSVSNSSTGSSSVTVAINGITANSTVLNSGKELTFTVKLSYSVGTSGITNWSKTINITTTWVQAP